MNKRCPVCGGPIHNGIEHVPDNCIEALLELIGRYRAAIDDILMVFDSYVDGQTYKDKLDDIQLICCGLIERLKEYGYED